MPIDEDDGFFSTSGNDLKLEVVNSSWKYRVCVLVCAPSNSALDEIVLRILNTGSYPNSVGTRKHGYASGAEINIHFDGSSLFGKNDTSKALKKGGGLGGRKTLNDISNSAKPSSLQASKKNYTSVISIGKDLNATKNKFPAETKDNFAKVHDKGGRKALTDLTNSRKPSAKQGSKKGLDKKLSAAAANIPMLLASSGASKLSVKSMGSRIPITSSIICLIYIQLKRSPNQQKLFKRN